MPGQAIPISPDVLKWARGRVGLSLSQAANRLSINEDELAAVEAGAQPLESRLLNRMERTYGLSRDILLFPSRPQDEPPFLPRDFRSHKKGDPLSLATLSAIREGRELQALLTELRDQGDGFIRPFAFERASEHDNPEDIATRERARLGVSIETQSSWDRRKAFREWADVLMSLGLFVLLKPMDWDDCRGVSLCDAGLVPVIVVTTEDTEGARCFSLFHEYAHCLLDQAARCTEEPGNTPAGRTESWCNRFAAAFLMPSNAVREALRDVYKHEDPDGVTKRHVELLAARFGVSIHAMAIRLSQVQVSSFYERHGQEIRSYDRKKRAKPRTTSQEVKRQSLAQVRLREVGAQACRILFDAVREGRAEVADAADALHVSYGDLIKLEARSRDAPA